MTSSAGHAVPAAPRQSHRTTFAVLALAGTTYAVLQSLVAPALPDIQRELHTSSTSAAWILTAYLLTASISTPIVGRLGDMFGKERVLVYTLVGLAIGSALSAVATDITTMIAGRLIQGSAGALFPLAFSIIRDEFPPERVAGGIAMFSGLLGIGSGLGIVLSGPIVETFSYHFLFWIPFALVVVAIVATILFVPESPIKVPGRIHWLGAVLLTAWLVCVLLGISQGSSWGWGDSRTIGLIVLGLVLLLVWVAAESRSSDPLIDMGLMRQRGIWTVNAAAFMVGAGMFSSLVLIPNFTQTEPSAGYGFGATVTESGLFLLPSTVTMLLAGPLAPRIAARAGRRAVLLVGALATAVAYLQMAFAHDERWEIFVGSAVMGLGIGLAFGALANLIVEVAPRSQTGVATGMNTVMRTIGGSVGTTVAASIVTGTVVGSALPTEHGYEVAFVLGAALSFVAALMCVLVPRSPGGARAPAGAAAPAGARG